MHTITQYTQALAGSFLKQKATAPVEDSTTSAHAYTVGKHLIYNEVLYKVTAPIAIGDALVVNTNISATNVITEVEASGQDIGLSIVDGKLCVTYETT